MGISFFREGMELCDVICEGVSNFVMFFDDGWVKNRPKSRDVIYGRPIVGLGSSVSLMQANLCVCKSMVRLSSRPADATKFSSVRN